ncbi:MAG: aspartate--tRNA ligase [Candidatus Caenarcaniphilales bacterium]|nr:aspartate--tRNA ligase [Candidatus Caenarcaniphilales bacterium]
MTYRTHLCGTLTQSDEDTEVLLAGWVDVRRDLGGVIFIELRDHTGRIQVVSDPQITPELHTIFETLRSEYCLQVSGKIRTRPTGTENEDLRTGAVEVVPSEVKILNTCKPLPLPIKDFAEADESFRLKYRWLDLRRPEMQTNIRLRHQVTQVIREYLVKNGFLEIETPILTRSTPEGARDYLVPSRQQEGSFYALPQSPQLFKQLLVISGFERYFQIARCFRDEDLRADRQPEFTQVDLEIGFTTVDEVIEVASGLLQAVFESIERPFDLPIQRMSYAEAISLYGSDKPDLRFGLRLIDFTDVMQRSGFEAFAQVTRQGGIVKGLCVPDTAGWSRKDFDDLRTLVMKPEYGAKGLAWISYKEGEDPLGTSPIAKFFTSEELAEIKSYAHAKTGDSIFFVADKSALAHQVLGRLRLYLGEKLDLIDQSKDSFVWIIDWPLVERDLDTGTLQFMHHPFTAFNPEDAHLMSTEPEKIRAYAYDIVYNGVELGGGSIRSHQESAQRQFLHLLGMSDQEIDQRFGFLVNALAMGAPPHGGIALGLDRLVMLLAHEESIRQVIAFPKVQSGGCPLTGAPASVEEKQLHELALRIYKPKS